VLPTANPPAFRLHYASLQRHFNKLPYLDIYLYSRGDSTDKDEPEVLPRACVCLCVRTRGERVCAHTHL
jgi:hypothetical protein